MSGMTEQEARQVLGHHYDMLTHHREKLEQILSIHVDGMKEAMASAGKKEVPLEVFQKLEAIRDLAERSRGAHFVGNLDVFKAIYHHARVGINEAARYIRKHKCGREDECPWHLASAMVRQALEIMDTTPTLRERMEDVASALYRQCGTQAEDRAYDLALSPPAGRFRDADVVALVDAARFRVPCANHEDGHPDNARLAHALYPFRVLVIEDGPGQKGDPDDMIEPHAADCDVVTTDIPNRCTCGAEDRVKP